MWACGCMSQKTAREVSTFSRTATCSQSHHNRADIFAILYTCVCQTSICFGNQMFVLFWNFGESANICRFFNIVCIDFPGNRLDQEYNSLHARADKGMRYDFHCMPSCFGICGTGRLGIKIFEIILIPGYSRCSLSL